jgi:ligand-binding SRPBCC domain-containing protein
MELFEHRVSLPVPAEQVFDFLIRPKNHERISPPHVGLVFTQAPPVISLGSRLEFKVVAYGMIQNIVHEVVEFEAGRYVEQAISGPLKVFFQEYKVEAENEQQCLFISTVKFAPPGGLMGMLLTTQKICDTLEEGFDYRADAMKKVLAT